MKTDKLLTYVLYALLGGLVIVAGQKACKLKEDKAMQAKESSDMSKALQELGYSENDSTGGGTTHSDDGTYKDGTAENATKTATGGGEKITNAAKNGIEVEEETKPVTSSTTSKSIAAKSEDDDAPSKTKVRDLDSEGSDSPKYMVLAGTFTKMDNAREQMETLVKKGFQEAEVGKFNRGKFACAIAKRTNSLSEAKAVMAKLKAKGFKDAIVKSRN
jgi:cell division septation protein DedD